MYILLLRNTNQKVPEVGTVQQLPRLCENVSTIADGVIALLHADRASKTSLHVCHWWDDAWFDSEASNHCRAWNMRKSMRKSN